jgi:uncharacterized protein (DUF885 family)
MTSETEFYKQSEEWLDRMLELNPVTATQLGDYRWNDRLADYSEEGLEELHRELREGLEDLEAIDPQSFSHEGQIDYTLMLHTVRMFQLQLEELKNYLRDPTEYLNEVMGGVFLLILRQFAPLPERLESALARIKEIPRVLEQGQKNIIPQRVPPIWINVAMEQAQMAPALFSGLLPGLAAQATPELEAEFNEAGQKATEAIQAYAEYMEKELRPQAQGEFAVGEEMFNTLLREQHMVDYDAEELLEIGWEQLHSTKAQMEEVSREIDPDKNVKQILEEAKADHPDVDGVLEAYEQAMDAARRYVIEHDIVTIPPDETLRIVETPPYMRPIIPYAAYMPPGILEEVQEGIFLVTPVDPESPPEQQEQKLKGHNYAKLPVVALHEAYPGHHLQLVWSNRQKQVARRMGSFLATLFIEGWAFYCEEMMEQLGYIDAPVQRLGRLADQLWRAARIIIDVSLHTRGMSTEEAVDFLVEECQLEPDNAQAEVNRYTSTPTQPQSYLMGKLAILELVEEYKQAHPDATLKEVHDAILGCGSLPPSLMRRCLMGEE